MDTMFNAAEGFGTVARFAREIELAPPIGVMINADGRVHLNLRSLEDLDAWATIAGANITTARPEPYDDLPDQWVVRHTGSGAIHDLPVDLVAVVFGRMAEPVLHACATCGAEYGTTGGFVADGEVDDDDLGDEVAFHTSGDCTRAEVTA